MVRKRESPPTAAPSWGFYPPGDCRRWHRFGQQCNVKRGNSVLQREGSAARDCPDRKKGTGKEGTGSSCRTVLRTRPAGPSLLHLYPLEPVGVCHSLSCVPVISGTPDMSVRWSLVCRLPPHEGPRHCSPVVLKAVPCGLSFSPQGEPPPPQPCPKFTQVLCPLAHNPYPCRLTHPQRPQPAGWAPCELRGRLGGGLRGSERDLSVRSLRPPPSRISWWPRGSPDRWALFLEVCCFRLEEFCSPRGPPAGAFLGHLSLTGLMRPNCRLPGPEKGACGLGHTAVQCLFPGDCLAARLRLLT